MPQYPSSQLFHVYSEEEWHAELAIKLLKLLGWYKILPMDRDDLCRSDAAVVIIGDSEAVQDITSNHPYNPLFIVHDVNELKAVVGKPRVPEKVERELTGTERAPKKRVFKRVRCDFCEADIGDTVLGVERHQARCTSLPTQVVAGHLITVRQPSGRTKGSVLTVYLPEGLGVDGYFYEAGIQLVANPQAIKKLNHVLGKRYKYELKRSEEEET